MSHFPQALFPQEEDIKQMLSVGVHLGSQNVQPAMNRYVWRRRSDGVHIINLAKTWEKLMLAARVIAGIENAADICVISGNKFGQRAALKFAHFTGANAISGRFTPGTFTNQIQDKFTEPRLLIVTDPRVDHQPITESSYVNLPTIAFCNVDSSVKHIDIAIPCNNRSTESIGLLYWLLAREFLRLRNQIPRNQPWDVMVDLFFYRPPEDISADKKALEDQQHQHQQHHQHQAHQQQHQQQHHQQSAPQQHAAPFDQQQQFRPTPEAEGNWQAREQQQQLQQQQQQQQQGVGGSWDAATGQPWDAPVTSTRWDS